MEKDKEICYYDACLKGWLSTRLEKDKSILKFDLVGLCIFAYFSAFPNEELKNILIRIGMSFLAISILTCIHIFQKNSDYLEDVVCGKEPKSILRKLDVLNYCFFSIGLIILIFVI